MNTRTILTATSIAGGLLGLGLVLYYLYKEPKGEIESEEKSTPAAVPKRALKKQPVAEKSKKTSPASRAKTKTADNRFSPPPHADEFPLRLGSKGKRVERLRIWLMRNYGWTGIINDEFDKQTEQLLKRYLKKTQLDEASYYKLRMEQNFYSKPK